MIHSPLANSAEPEIRSVNVRGLQVRGTTTLVIDGDEFGSNPRLLLTFPAKQTLKPGSTGKQAMFEVTLDDNAVAGYSHLRIVTDGGVSLPVVIGVDRLPQRPIVPTVDALPMALHGTVNGSTVVETAFVGKTGQKVIVEVEAQRLGGKLRPVAHLYDAKRLQLAWSWPIPVLHGDTRLEAVLPTDGLYTVAIHDAEYAAQPPGFFRLRIGQWSYVDQVFPPVVGKENRAVEFLGSELVQLDIATPRTASAVMPLHFPKNGIWSGPRPFVELSTRTELVEPPASAKPHELPAGALGVSGRLSTPFEEDRYRVAVSPGSKVRFEVFAERIGSPIDLALVVRSEAGVDLVRAEDSPGTLDPVLEYTVPDKVTAIQVAVLDVHGHGGPRAAYRLTIDPNPAAPADFQMLTPARRVSLAAHGHTIVPVLVNRRGYAGRIDVIVDGLPPGSKLENATILPGTDATLLVIRPNGPPDAARNSTWRGRAETGVERPVVQRGHPLERLQPWLAEELAVAPTVSRAGAFSIDWRNLPADAALTPVGGLTLPVAVKRAFPLLPVRLTLLTSQSPVLANNQPDPNRTIRAEKPTEIAAKVVNGEVVVRVPAELPAPTYDVAIQAELLAADKKTVLATAFTPVRRLPVRLPYLLKLDAARVDAKRDPKTGVTAELTGQVERAAGFTGDVALVLTGLPGGARAENVTVKTGATKYVVKITLPANAPAGEIKGLKLTSTAAPDPKQPNQRVRGRELDVVVNVPK